eukprot:CCRYP_006488-RA/>CCRYP_006488-RA protein AED:0.11 eAED:0.11 QI:0/-1/0/1/-1/1/1/0/401
MPRSLHIPNAPPAHPPPPNHSLHEHDHLPYPIIYPHYYPPSLEHESCAESNSEFTFLEAAHNDDDGETGLTHDFESKPAAAGAAQEQAEIRGDYGDNGQLERQIDDPGFHGNNHHNYDMRQPPPPPPHGTPHTIHPYYNPYPPPFPPPPPPPSYHHAPVYAPPPYYYPPYPPPPSHTHHLPPPPPPPTPLEPTTHRKLRKNAQSRARAQTLRTKIHALRHLPHKTPHQLHLLQKYEARRQTKNVRTRQRAAETKARLEEIARKPEEERTEEEREVWRVGMERRRRKNEGDRLRRVKLKEMGWKVKPVGVEVRGHEDRVVSVGVVDGRVWSEGCLGLSMSGGGGGGGGEMMMGGELEGEPFGELERHDLDKLMTEEVSQLLMQDDDDDDNEQEEDMDKVVNH